MYKNTESFVFSVVLNMIIFYEKILNNNDNTSTFLDVIYGF